MDPNKTQPAAVDMDNGKEYQKQVRTTVSLAVCVGKRCGDDIRLNKQKCAQTPRSDLCCNSKLWANPLKQDSRV
jgi:hypothetical protein